MQSRVIHGFVAHDYACALAGGITTAVIFCSNGETPTNGKGITMGVGQSWSCFGAISLFKHNLYILSSYIPLIGAASGLHRILEATLHSNQYELVDQVQLIVRGIFEILDAGSVFLLLDPGLGFGRLCAPLLSAELTKWSSFTAQPSS